MKKHKNIAKKTAIKRVMASMQYTDRTLPGFENYDTRPVVDRLREATRPMMAQVAPGKFAPWKAKGKVQEYCLCMWHDNGDGTYSPIPVNQRLLRLDRELASLLGFPGQYATLRRLGVAEMVEIMPVAPHCYFINLDSWFNHIRRCAENPEIWSEGSKYLKAYRSVIG
jgi:hypothetical protein